MRARERSVGSRTIRSAVREYFTTLQAELRGRRWWHALGAAGLGQRWQRDETSRPDRVQRQVSAVLITHGLPYVADCAPLPEPEPAVADAVADYLRNHPHILELMEQDVFRAAEAVPKVSDHHAVMVSAPAADEVPQAPDSSDVSRLLAGVDFLAREQRNRSLATAGHQFVLAFEDTRLRAQGLDDYANAIEYTAVEGGDGVGYTIHSYGLDGSDRLIEVKTTRYGRETPFYVSAHEVAMSRRHGSRFWVYRVFSFRERPRLYMLHGALDHAVTLDPTEYRATPR